MEAAGEKSQALEPELPDAATTTSPRCAARSIAASMDQLRAPPRESTAAPGAPRRSRSFTAHASPSMMPDHAPAPSSSSTLTGCSVAPRATPTVAPPADPAMCVPCP